MKQHTQFYYYSHFYKYLARSRDSRQFISVAFTQSSGISLCDVKIDLIELTEIDRLFYCHPLKAKDQK